MGAGQQQCRRDDSYHEFLPQTHPTGVTMSEQISINGPQSVTLSPQTLVVVLQALNELPYKIAQPAIAEIMAQVKANETAV